MLYKLTVVFIFKNIKPTLCNFFPETLKCFIYAWVLSFTKELLESLTDLRGVVCSYDENFNRKQPFKMKVAGLKIEF